MKHEQNRSYSNLILVFLLIIIISFIFITTFTIPPNDDDEDPIEPTTKLQGFALFKTDYMSTTDWNAWLSWDTKDTYYAGACWMIPNSLLDLNEAGRQALLTKFEQANIKYIYLQCGCWVDTNTLSYDWSQTQIKEFVNYVHANSDISVQGWFWCQSVLQIDTAAKRQAMANQIITCVQTCGFDGWNDDVENFDSGNSLYSGSHPDQLIAWWNLVASSMDSIGKQSSACLMNQYTVTVAPYVNVDKIVVMAYNGGAKAGSELTGIINNVLTYSKAPVLVGLYTTINADENNYIILPQQLNDINAWGGI